MRSLTIVIYAFLLGFSSPSHYKEWFKIWKIKDQPNHTNHINQATKLTLLSCTWRSSSKLQVIQSWETLFQRPSKVHKYQYTQTHCFVYFWFSLFLFFFFKKKEEEKNLKIKQKQMNKQTNKVSKLDWLTPQHKPCKRSKKRRN